MPETTDPSPADGDLQFDRAEFAAPSDEAAPRALECSACGRTIADRYFEINAQVACPECHAAALAERTGGSELGRFLRALVLGALAGAVGAALYYGVAALTGYELALIALVVGLLVGFGVRIGSRQRGGWLYQLMAVAITYFSIGAAYGLMAVTEMAKPPEERRVVSEEHEAVPDPVVTEEGDRQEGAAPEAVSPASEEFPEGVTGVIILVVIFLAAVVAGPILAVFESWLSLIIIGVGLYEAWRINKRVAFAASGPFQVGAGPAAAA